MYWGEAVVAASFGYSTLAMIQSAFIYEWYNREARGDGDVSASEKFFIFTYRFADIVLNTVLIYFCAVFIMDPYYHFYLMFHIVNLALNYYWILTRIFQQEPWEARYWTMKTTTYTFTFTFYIARMFFATLAGNGSTHSEFM